MVCTSFAQKGVKNVVRVSINYGLYFIRTGRCKNCGRINTNYGLHFVCTGKYKNVVKVNINYSLYSISAGICKGQDVATGDLGLLLHGYSIRFSK